MDYYNRLSPFPPGPFGASVAAMQSHRRVGVIGAGPAGLTAAYELAKAGVAVEVFESAEQVGGMAKTIDLWNQKVDLGPHRFFSSDRRVNDLWLEVVGRDYRMVDRLTRIYYNKKFFLYPLKPIDALSKLGLWETFRCLTSYAVSRGKSTDSSSFEDWVVSRFGRRLYSIFFKTYSEKLWGIPCHEIDSDFAAQRIKKLSLLEAVRSALRGNRGNEHKTLVDRFPYPTGGTGMVYERMADFIRSKGGHVHLGARIRRVLVEGRRVTGIETQDGVTHAFDHVISTMPLTSMVKELPNLPAAVEKAVHALTFRNTILVYLNVKAQNLFPDNWIYVHSQDLLVGRITNFRNWVPELTAGQDSSILTLEYWCNLEDAMWAEEPTTLIARAKEELRKTGLIGDAEISEGFVVKLPRSYPIYRRGYREHVSKVADYLDTLNGLSVIGRFGSFKYNNQDHSILMGLLAAENLTQGTRHSLWAINTDYETYQENCRIEETGLVLSDQPA